MKIGARGHDLGVNKVDDIIERCKELKITGLQLVVNKTWENLYNNRDIDGIVKKY